jgi:hypothetical protein
MPCFEVHQGTRRLELSIGRVVPPDLRCAFLVSRVIHVASVSDVTVRDLRNARPTEMSMSALLSSA